MKKSLSRLCAALLSLAMLCTSAFALTTEQAAELLDLFYVDAVPEAVWDQPTVEAMLEQLGDPYTEYFDAETYRLFLDSMRDDTLVGIGISASLHAEGLLLSTVFEDSPAYEAGLQAGDVITAVDGKSAKGEALDTVSAWLRGEEGTQVTVTALRDGQTKTYTMTRRVVVIPATTTELVDGHIGYIDCRTFGEETLGHFNDGITRYDGDADRWVVDLRTNGGGDVNAAVQAAGTFTGSGNLTYLRGKDGMYQVYRREEGGLTLDPAIVLVDGYTASASELFSSAVRDMGAGIVVGSRTFGKGVAQVMLDQSTLPEFFDDGSGLKVTAYRYFSPGGATTDKVGVIPHLLMDDQYAPGAAYLLSASRPDQGSKGYLRLDMVWRWYIDLEIAASEEYRELFAALLEAIPPQVPLQMGKGGDKWERVDPAQVAAEYGLDGYAGRGFTDLEESKYENEINALGIYGVVTGPGDGSFQPEELLTRAEFCQMLASALQYTPKREGEQYFADVPADAWYAGAVNAMYDMGLVSGVGGGRFDPDAPMDHQQFITILARCAQRLSTSFYEASLEEHSAALEDESLKRFAGWSREGVWLLTQSQTNVFGEGISMLWDDLTYISPAASTTREQAAASVYSVLSYTGILPV